MLAKADGVEYVSRAGSSLTVITRTKSMMDMTTKRTEIINGMDWGTSVSYLYRGPSSGSELKVKENTNEGLNGYM